MIMKKCEWEFSTYFSYYFIQIFCWKNAYQIRSSKKGEESYQFYIL